MEHPLIGKLDDLSLDELSFKITDLNKKLTIAMRMGNADLCNQIRMAIESYRTKYMEKNDALLRKGDQGKTFDDIIDIS